mmetsp:Transcript_203/g.523  ORF Transcript_203/g.523 Transcript_203/m.523 type:complete len:591 (+) Transcript_203:41-1813(+)
MDFWKAAQQRVNSLLDDADEIVEKADADKLGQVLKAARNDVPSTPVKDIAKSTDPHLASPPSTPSLAAPPSTPATAHRGAEVPKACLPPLPAPPPKAGAALPPLAAPPPPAPVVGLAPAVSPHRVPSALGASASAGPREQLGQQSQVAEPLSPPPPSVEVTESEDQAKLRVVELEREVEELRQQLLRVSSRDARQAEAMGQPDSIDAVRKEMEEELATILKQKDAQLAAQKSKVADLEERMRIIQTDLDGKESEIVKLNDRAQQKLEGRDEELVLLRKQLDDQRTDHAAEVEKLEQFLHKVGKSSSSRNMDLQAFQDATHQEIAKLEQQVSQVTQENQLLQAQLQESQCRYDDLAEELSVSSAKTSGDTSDTQGELARLQRAVLAAEEDARQAQRRFEDARSEAATLRRELTTIGHDLAMLRTSKAEVEQELQTLSEQLKQQPVQQPSHEGLDSIVKAMEADFETRTMRLKEEVQYLRKRCEEKDRRLEVLVCEKQAMGVQLQQAHQSPADLELGPAPKPRSELIRAPGVGSRPWVLLIDEPFRVVVRILATSPLSRWLFFAYVVALQGWVFFMTYAMLRTEEAAEQLAA